MQLFLSLVLFFFFFFFFYFVYVSFSFFFCSRRSPLRDDFLRARFLNLPNGLLGDIRAIPDAELRLSQTIFRFQLQFPELFILFRPLQKRFHERRR